MCSILALYTTSMQQYAAKNFFLIITFFGSILQYFHLSIVYPVFFLNFNTILALIQVVQNSHDKQPRVSFGENRRPTKLMAKRSTSTIEVAEKREKRVLVQMSVLVIAFLLFWLPFWITFITMHICMSIYPLVNLHFCLFV